MAQITLVVTQRGLDYSSQNRASEAQIAIRSPSADIATDIGRLSTTNRATLRLGGCINLIVGDPSAIWRAHNHQYLEDFESLFTLLARRPDHEMRFLCELV